MKPIHRLLRLLSYPQPLFVLLMLSDFHPTGMLGAHLTKIVGEGGASALSEALVNLRKRGLIAKSEKPHRGSCRYTLTSAVKVLPEWIELAESGMTIRFSR